MPSIGVLFDISVLGDGLYGHAAYRALFAAMTPRRLAGCELSDGDVGSQYYCITIESDDVQQLAEARRLLAQSNALGLNPEPRRFLTGEQVDQLALVRAAYVTREGELARCQTPWLKDAWEAAHPAPTPPPPSESAGPGTATVSEAAASDTSSIDSGEALPPTVRVPSETALERPMGPRQYLPGQIVGGKYYIRAVHKGGMGLVYIVDVLSSLRAGSATVLALKTFQDRFLWNEDAISRFEREAMRWTALDIHPHVVTAMLVERLEGRPYIWLEYVDGQSLADRMADRPIDVASCIELSIQFVRGMRHAYERHGLLHRDIKPANCMLTRDGVLKIADFGLSKFRAELLTHTADAGPSPGFPFPPSSSDPGARAGTPAYMPPEVILDPVRVDTRGDIYSFGVMLHEMLAGRPLFRGPNIASVLQQHLHAHVVAPGSFNSAVPPELDAVVLACLEKDPGRRYSTFGDLELALEPIAARLLGSLPALPPHGSVGVSGKLFLRAFTLMEFGRHAAAVDTWHELLRLTPDEAEAHNNVAVCLAELGQLQDACAAARRAIELKPEYAEALANLGGFLGRLGRFQEGVAACDRAIAINPDWAEGYANRGANLVGLLHFEQAAASFEQTLRVDPKYWRAHVLAAEALARRGCPPAEVLAQVRRALHIHPREPTALAMTAACLDDLGEENEADQYLSLAEAVAAHDPLVLRIGEAIRRKRACG